MPAGRVGQWESVTGVRPAYAADAAKRSQVTQAPAPAPGGGGARQGTGGRTPGGSPGAPGLHRPGEACPGVPAFRTGRGGFRLLAEDEEGEPLPPEQLLTIVALIEYEDGAGRVAVPDAAPAAIDTPSRRLPRRRPPAGPGRAGGGGAVRRAALAAGRPLCRLPHLRPPGHDR